MGTSIFTLLLNFNLIEMVGSEIYIYTYIYIYAHVYIHIVLIYVYTRTYSIYICAYIYVSMYRLKVYNLQSSVLHPQKEVVIKEKNEVSVQLFVTHGL